MDIAHWLLELGANVALGVAIALHCWAGYRLDKELKSRFSEMNIETDPERPGGSSAFILRREYRQLRDAKVTLFGDLVYFGALATMALFIFMLMFGLQVGGIF